MEQPTVEELKAQAARQRQSGDSYMSIGNYLKSTGAAPETIKEVIAYIDLMEKENLLKPISQKPKMSFVSGFMGGMLIFLGILLTWMLWGMGWVSTLPIIMNGPGCAAFGGSFDR